MNKKKLITMSAVGISIIVLIIIAFVFFILLNSSAYELNIKVESDTHIENISIKSADETIGSFDNVQKQEIIKLNRSLKKMSSEYPYAPIQICIQHGDVEKCEILTNFSENGINDNNLNIYINQDLTFEINKNRFNL